MDGWEAKVRFKRKRIKNPPKVVRELGINRKLVDRIFWPIESDLLDIEPPPWQNGNKGPGIRNSTPFS